VSTCLSNVARFRLLALVDAKLDRARVEREADGAPRPATVLVDVGEKARETLAARRTHARALARAFFLARVLFVLGRLEHDAVRVLCSCRPSGSRIPRSLRRRESALRGATDFSRADGRERFTSFIGPRDVYALQLLQRRTVLRGPPRFVEPTPPRRSTRCRLRGRPTPPSTCLVPSSSTLHSPSQACRARSFEGEPWGLDHALTWNANVTDRNATLGTSCCDDPQQARLGDRCVSGRACGGRASTGTVTGTVSGNELDSQDAIFENGSSGSFKWHDHLDGELLGGVRPRSTRRRDGEQYFPRHRC